jgi:hypothetical protein
MNVPDGYLFEYSQSHEDGASVHVDMPEIGLKTEIQLIQKILSLPVSGKCYIQSI